MKNTFLLLCICYTLVISTGNARALEVQAAPVVQDSPTMVAAGKQPANIGPSDPKKAHGVKMDVFINKNLAMSSRILLLPSEPNLQNGLAGTSEGIRINPSQISGIVGVKVLF